MTEIHPSEPNLGTLKKISKELFKAESTSENLQKIKAITVQIERHEKRAKEVEELVKAAAKAASAVANKAVKTAEAK